MSQLKFSSVPEYDPKKFQVQGLPLGTALLKILRGIQTEWELSDSEMAEILNRSPSTYSTWKQTNSLSVSPDKPTPNDQVIFAFIDIYDLVSDLIYTLDQRKEWIRQKNEAFGNKSPLEIMKTGASNLFRFKEYMIRLMNP